MPISDSPSRQTYYHISYNVPCGLLCNIIANKKKKKTNHHIVPQFQEGHEGTHEWSTSHHSRSAKTKSGISSMLTPTPRCFLIFKWRISHNRRIFLSTLGLSFHSRLEILSPSMVLKHNSFETHETMLTAMGLRVSFLGLTQNSFFILQCIGLESRHHQWVERTQIQKEDSTFGNFKSLLWALIMLFVDVVP